MINGGATKIRPLAVGKNHGLIANKKSGIARQLVP